jgi:rhodanese-related sulfurtransferase
MKKSLYLVIGLLMLIYSIASADAFKTISAEELKRIMDAKKQIVLVDARTEQEFAQGHIPKAINIPPEKVNEIGQLLPKNKTVPLIFYCRGAGWGLSKQAAVAAEKAGYRDLQVFPGGYPEWTAKGYKTVTK